MRRLVDWLLTTFKGQIVFYGPLMAFLWGLVLAPWDSKHAENQVIATIMAVLATLLTLGLMGATAWREHKGEKW